MTLDHVPNDDLVHVLKRVLEECGEDEETSAAWLGRLQSKDAEEVEAAHNYIDEVFPGTTARLDEAWAFFAQRAIHLWKLTYLAEGATQADVFERFPQLRA
jgi:hypothetical protein